jgi:hypothetical protein
MASPLLVGSRKTALAMTTDRTNYLNLALMVASAVAAFVLPFQVFLLAYAVLGPLHYLTEISWLHDRRYFLKGKRDGLPLVLLCAALLMVAFTHWSPDRKNEATTFITYLAFAGAGVLLVARTTVARVLSFAVVMLSFVVARQSELCLIFFGVFLPTIVHVFIFTGAFLMLGALRGRSRSAFASLAVFALCAMSFFIYLPSFPANSVSSAVRQAYAPFEHLNLVIFRVFHSAAAGSRDAVYQSPQGLAVMRFIAFAYLYHYLNWFSKTSIIKWDRMSRPRAFVIAGLWMASLWIYSTDSRTGLVILLTLSFAHGFLELPLDHQTFLNIGRELIGLAGERLRPTESTESTSRTEFA